YAQARASDAVNEALTALTDFYVGGAQSADRAFIKDRNRVFSLDGVAAMTFRDDVHAMSWLEAERHNLLALQRLLYERGRFRRVMELAEAMWPLYIGTRFLEDWLTSSELAVEAAVAANDIVGEVRLRAFLARALMENA